MWMKYIARSYTIVTPPNKFRILNQDGGGEHKTCMERGKNVYRILVKKPEEKIAPKTGQK